ncbi:MAG TPA: two-component system response regulator CreB [Fluviicoccus sp.]|nr:two-component system response regulator CreB [Fluviicoccus sp.]
MTGTDTRHILLIEDDPAIAEPLIYALGREGWQVHWRTLVSDALSFLQQQTVDFIILDVGLPDGNGFDLCREIRRHWQTPLLFLTARNDEIERIIGLEIGADDYCAKPFSPREIISRIRVIWRRGAVVAAVTEPAAQGWGPWRYDDDRLQIRYHDRLLNLTRHEHRLLRTLLDRPEHVLSRARLMQAAWDHPDHSLERTVDTHIKTLRQKLREAAGKDPIQTHRGLGYALVKE